MSKQRHIGRSVTPCSVVVTGFSEEERIVRNVDMEVPKCMSLLS